LVIASVVALAPTAGYGESRLGQKVDDFQLQSQLGRDWSLSDLDDKKIVVLAFLGTECPLVKLYGPRLSEMREEFADQGVEFLGINSNTQDSLTEMRNFVDRYNIKFPMLKDLGNVVADALKAERTPEILCWIPIVRCGTTVALTMSMRLASRMGVQRKPNYAMRLSNYWPAIP